VLKRRFVAVPDPLYLNVINKINNGILKPGTKKAQERALSLNALGFLGPK